MRTFAFRRTNVLLRAFSTAFRDVAAREHIEYLLLACVIDVGCV